MTKQIINPFGKNGVEQGNTCFGCSGENKIGLHLHFTDCGEYIESLWVAQKQFEGFKDVVHGGIQATLLDEIAAWVVYTKCKTAGVTQNISVHYHNPARITTLPMRLVGTLVSQNKRTAVIKAELFSSEGVLYASAEVEYFIFPEAVAVRRYGYPGIEAFYEQKT